MKSKSKNLTVVILTFVLSAVVFLFVGNFFFGYQSLSTTIEDIDTISPEFDSLPVEYFNDNSINPYFRTEPLDEDR